MLQRGHTEIKSVPNIKSDCKFDGHNFILGDSVYSDKLICFFTTSCCPTCVLDVKKYSKSIIDCPKVLFCIDEIDYTNINFYDIFNPTILNFSGCWKRVEKPLLFQTDKYGTIFNVLEVQFDEPYKVKKYLLKLKEK